MLVLYLSYNCYSLVVSYTGSVSLHESMSVHHLPRGSTATGLQPLQDNGPQAFACFKGAWNCKYTTHSSACTTYIYIYYVVSVTLSNISFHKHECTLDVAALGQSVISIFLLDELIIMFVFACILGGGCHHSP